MRGRCDALSHYGSDYDHVSARISNKTYEKVHFVKDYLQFKPLIEYIIFKDENLDIVKVVPIDDYLAEN